MRGEFLCFAIYLQIYMYYNETNLHESDKSFVLFVRIENWISECIFFLNY
jgi:hypothetical protein